MGTIWSQLRQDIMDTFPQNVLNERCNEGKLDPCLDVFKIELLLVCLLKIPRNNGELNGCAANGLGSGWTLSNLRTKPQVVTLKFSS